MAFRKIRETVAAFRKHAAPMTFEEKLRAQHALQTGRARQGPPPSGSLLVVRIVVLVFVVVPVSLLVSKILHRIFNLNLEATGVVTSMILTYAISTLHGAITNRVVASIRPQVLRWYFGSKVEETTVAFRRYQ